MENEKSFLQRIQEIRTREHNLSDWEKSFLDSIEQRLRSWDLSPKQQSVLERIEENSKISLEEKNANRNKWYASFDDEKRKIFVACVNYYKSCTILYYVDIINKFNKDKNYIPAEHEYNKLCLNKFTKKIAESIQKGPQFKEGEICQARSSIKFAKSIRRDGGPPYYLEFQPSDLFMIVESKEEYRSSAKGARIYSVLPVGKSYLVDIEERHLKTYKKNSK